MSQPIRYRPFTGPQYDALIRTFVRSDFRPPTKGALPRQPVTTRYGWEAWVQIQEMSHHAFPSYN